MPVGTTKVKVLGSQRYVAGETDHHQQYDHDSVCIPPLIRRKLSMRNTRDRSTFVTKSWARCLVVTAVVYTCTDKLVCTNESLFRQSTVAEQIHMRKMYMSAIMSSLRLFAADHRHTLTKIHGFTKFHGSRPSPREEPGID